MNHETAVSNAKEIADRILAPAARQNDKESRFTSEAVAALGPAGLLGIMLPTEVGGSALGPRTFAAVIATLAEADASAAMVYLMHMSATATIAAARPGATVAQALLGACLASEAQRCKRAPHGQEIMGDERRSRAKLCCLGASSGRKESNGFDPLSCRQRYARTVCRRPMGRSRDARQCFRADEPRGVRSCAWSPAD